MQYRSLKGYSGPGQLGILIGLLGAGLVLTALVQMLIASLMVPGFFSLQGDTAAALKKAISNPANVNFTIMMQVAGTFFLMFLPSLVFSFVVNGKEFFWLGFNRYLNGHQLLAGLGIIICANFIAGPFDMLSRSLLSHFPSISHMAGRLEENYMQNVAIFSSLHSVSGFFVGLIVIAFLPAMFEEVFFRGVCQGFLTRWWNKPILALICTSLFFSLIHGSIYLFISRAILGAALGLLFYYSNNIWLNILAHFMNNLIAFTQFFFSKNPAEEMKPENQYTPYDWIYMIVALAAVVFLIRYLNGKSLENRSRIHDAGQSLIPQPETSDIES